MNYKYYVSQKDETDCGAAALAMILKHYGANYPIAKLRDLARTTKRGTTALGIVKAAQKLGLEATAFKADISLFDENKKYPFIAHLVRNNLLHYCVVYKFDKNEVYIADPDPDVKTHVVSKEEFSRQWSGVCIFFEPTNNFIPQNEHLRDLRVSFIGVTKYKKTISFVVISAFIMTWISIAGSYYLQMIIDKFIPNKDDKILIISALALIIVYIVNSIFSYIREYFLTKLNQKISANISLEYIQHVLKLPMHFFATRKTGEITSRFNDINKIIDAISGTVISIFLDAGTMFIISIILIVYSKQLFWKTLLFLVVFVIIIYVFNKKFITLNQKQMESNAVLVSSIIEDFRGIETIKSLCLEEESYQTISKQFKNFLNKNLNYSKTKAFQNSLKSLVQYSLIAIILCQGAILVIRQQLSLGSLMAYDTLLAFFITPLQNIANLQTKLQEAKVANDRLNEVLVVDEESELDKENNNFKLQGKIEFRNVDYSYEYNRPILKHINLSIESNQKLAIVGKSGSGKSTLAKLLVDFFSPSHGEILIDDVNIQDFGKHELREFIKYIPQSPQLFSGTIKENLLMGIDKSISLSKLDKACKQAMIYEEIQKMPLKYNTRLDEEASNLSGGQRQRLIIARALLSSSKIIIFDESTSNLDPITEKSIVENLMKLTNRTVIFITHRLAIAKKINNIVVLDQGEIEKKGQHNELIRDDQLYRKLYEQ